VYRIVTDTSFAIVNGILGKVLIDMITSSDGGAVGAVTGERVMPDGAAGLIKTSPTSLSTGLLGFV
jgi:hypothetical protein